MFTTQEEKLLAEVRASMQEKPNIQLSSEEGKLLCLFAKLSNSEKILEIGTGVGYSTIWLAKALAEGGNCVSIEKSKDFFEMAQKNIKKFPDLEEKIKLHNMDAIEILDQYQSSKTSFDFIFIDANKSAYPEYLTRSRELITKGGMIVLDDILLCTDKAKLERGEWSIRDIPAIMQCNNNTSKGLKEALEMALSYSDCEVNLIPAYHGLLLISFSR